METSDLKVGDSDYIATKTAELKEFFKDAKFPQSVIDKAIENELKPLIQGVNVDRPYIAASASGTVKSEYEVMTGQPFTNIEDHSKPLTSEQIKELVKNSPIIAEKARQIQIVINHDSLNNDIAVPLDQVNISKYDDIQSELDSSVGDAAKQNTIKYRNMQVLMNAAAAYRSKSQIFKTQTINEENISNDSESSDEREFDAIDKVVTECTNKSYETRYQETKEMLQQLADKHEDPNEINKSERSPRKLQIEENKILKESSYCLVRGPKTDSSFEGIKESYAINDALNIPMKDNPIKLDLSGEIKNKIDSEQPVCIDKSNAEDCSPKNFEVKLKATEKVLNDINCILSKDEHYINENNRDETKSLSCSFKQTDSVLSLQNNSCNSRQANNHRVKFDENMERSLHNTLENIFEIGKNENAENNELEFREMKNLARNIVEGAENLNTLIKEDITNKLNSMNELLNGVNEALENSRKSNLAYQKLKEENEIDRKHRSITENDTEEIGNNIDNEPKSSSHLEINDIHSAINKLNDEIKCHESRINTSKANYESRNKECKEFLKDLDEVLQKSHSILHPKSTNFNGGNSEKMESKCLLQIDESDKVDESINCDVVKRDVVGNKDLEKNRKIDRLLYDIKDKMKDNKEVLRLANNLLRREENKKVSTSQSVSIVETDDKAKGDYVRKDELLDKNDNDKDDKILEVPPLDKVLIDKNEEEDKKQQEKNDKQRQFQSKIDKELEEQDRGPRMTKELIKNLCKQHKLYSTPYLNDILYLHFKGFPRIENLEEYTGLKCIFLENNGIQKIEGLDTLSELKCLYLHYNIVRKIENLNGCPKLNSLNLDHNFVTKIENLDVVPDLQTLSISHNMLSSIDDLNDLRFCKNLSVLDLSYNRLEDPIIVDVLADMAVLKVLVLTGNPVVRNIPAYRKTLTLRLLELLNLDNRPVFPRDRACAEAWRRGGVQEEVAERRRWIAKDQEKVMQSVRYLIKMRDENKAKREARELLEQEKTGLLAIENKNNEIDSKENFEGVKGIELNTEEKDVKSNSNVIEDTLTDSETDDTTSESDSSDSDKDSKGKIVICHHIIISPYSSTGVRRPLQMHATVVFLRQLASSSCQPSCANRHSTVPEDVLHYVCRDAVSTLEHVFPNGYRFYYKYGQPTATSAYYQETSKIEWSQIDQGKRLVQELKEEQSCEDQWTGFNMGPNSGDRNTSTDLNAISNLLFNQTPHVERQGTSEIITESIEQSKQKTKSDENLLKTKESVDTNERKPLIEIIEEYNKRSQESERNKGLNKVTIKEVKTDSTGDQDYKEKLSNKKILITEVNNDNMAEVKRDDINYGGGSDNEVNMPHANQQQITEITTTNELGTSDSDGVAFLKYMHRMNSKASDNNLDLEPSAEDLEIFEELEKEQVEREARFARGEPAVDPMKLYDEKIMQEFHKGQEPTPAHALEEKNFVTKYDHYNAFDRVALSQLTCGNPPDNSKVKITHIPGAVLYQNIEKQLPVPELQYHIGDEVIEPGPSSDDTESVYISNESDAISSESDILESPKSRNKQIVQKNLRGYKTKDNNCDEDGEADKLNDENSRKGDECHSTCETLGNMDSDEAKQSIIDAINSYEDNRFPSQGVNYSDMAQNARIEDSVATEILKKTIKYEEQEMYKQLDVVTSYASRVDNSTNTIIEKISDGLENEYTLPEVSRILETHIEEEEIHQRTLKYVNYIPSPTESLADDNEDTLVPSQDISLEDTLTEENEQGKASEANDSGICNESMDTGKVNDEIKHQNKHTDNIEVSNDEMKSEPSETQMVDVSADDEIFVDCEDDVNDLAEKVKKCDPVENYSLEMKLALGLSKD
ncbi:dynein axonemal assembly factor 1 homolog [Vanessa tameamea]|uniref:Dynein axonemal assembly factor 1 homolog n=1 Tax=Vanessa tameamea TaxID=334116 RepID=A0ABM4AU49_VANTA